MNQRPARERGTTVVELACSLFGLLALTGGIAAVMGTGMGVWNRSTLETNAESDANRALERIVGHLTYVGRDSVLAGFGEETATSSIEYRCVLGCTDGAVSWGDLLRIEWVPDPGDPEDGLDNNGNGLVDEGMVVLVRNPDLAGETRQPLVRGVAARLEGEVVNGLDDNGNGLVDERGLCFERRGTSVAVRISLARVGADGKRMLRSAETSITPRN